MTDMYEDDVAKNDKIRNEDVRLRGSLKESIRFKEDRGEKAE